MDNTNQYSQNPYMNNPYMPAKQTPAPTSNGNNDNFLAQILPTVGSIAAPIIGGIATGGTGLLAGSALSGLGAGAGKALANMLTGQDIGKGVGEEALTSGVSSLAFGGAGKILGKAANKFVAPAAQKAAGKLYAAQAPAGMIKPCLLYTSDAADE